MCFSSGPAPAKEEPEDSAEELDLIDEGTTNDLYGNSKKKTTDRLQIPLIGSSNTGSGLGV